MKKQIYFLALTLLVATSAQAAGVLEDLESLGGNQVLLERAEKLNPDKKIEIVQDRVVKRKMRSELNLDYGGVVGGDSYVSTQNLGLTYHLHLTHRWSIALRGTYHANRLTSEGQYLIDKAQELEGNLSSNAKKEVESVGLIPLIDYPKYSGYVIGNWYPIYGKINLHDLGVAQYDIYTLGGVGQVTLKSGSTTAFTAGGGIGFWLSQHLTSRFEVRYETFEAKRLAGQKERMNLTVLGISMGYLL